MRRSGFTLVEILVGLTIGSIAVSIAVGTFQSVGDQLHQLLRRAENHQERELARAWISDALLGVDVGPTGDRRFLGAPDTLDFRADAWVEHGWTESARVTVVEAAGRLEMRYGARRIVLLDSVADLSFRFSSTDLRPAAWVDRWDSLTEPPRVVRLDVRRHGGPAESMLFYVGDR